MFASGVLGRGLLDMGANQVYLFHRRLRASVISSASRCRCKGVVYVDTFM